MWWTGFQVDFWISRDSSFDIRFLGSRFLPAGFPGFFSTPLQNDFLTLPNASDAFWGASGAINIVMVVDATDAVFETQESNNFAYLPLTVDAGSGGGGQVYTDLNDLPETGVVRGVVLSGVISSRLTGLTAAATAQAKMASLLSKVAPVPNSSTDLKNLASGIKSVASSLSGLISGKVSSVTLAPGVVLDQAGLDLVERYLKHIFEQKGNGATVRSAGATSAMRAPVVAAAGDIFDPKWIPGYETFEKAQKWVSDTQRKITNTVDAIKNAPNKAVKWLADLFGRSGVEKGKAENEAKAVEEGGTKLKDRVQEMDNQLANQNMDDLFAQLDAQFTGAPKIFSLASSRLKALMKKNRDSVARLEDEVINLETWGRNQALLGTWVGGYDSIVGSGAISVIFKPAKTANRLSVTLSSDFFDSNGKLIGKTKGIGLGTMDADGVFRGTIETTNPGGGKLSGNIAWTLNENRLGGEVIDTPTAIWTFQATKRN